MKWDKIELQMIALAKKNIPTTLVTRTREKKESIVIDEKIYNAYLHDLIHAVNPIKEENG